MLEKEQISVENKSRNSGSFSQDATDHSLNCLDCPGKFFKFWSHGHCIQNVSNGEQEEPFFFFFLNHL